MQVLSLNLSFRHYRRLQKLTFEEVNLICVPVVEGGCDWIYQIRRQTGELVADRTSTGDSLVEGRVVYSDQVVFLCDFEVAN